MEIESCCFTVHLKNQLGTEWQKEAKVGGSVIRLLDPVPVFDVYVDNKPLLLQAK